MSLYHNWMDPLCVFRGITRNQLIKEAHLQDYMMQNISKHGDKIKARLRTWADKYHGPELAETLKREIERL